jgi:hypothetical protein
VLATSTALTAKSLMSIAGADAMLFSFILGIAYLVYSNMFVNSISQQEF